MGGFIVLNDGRAYAAANWAFRATLEAITDAIPETAEGRELAEWLRNDPTVQYLHSVDLRELTPTNRAMFEEATERAYKIASIQGSTDWPEPDYWTGWIGRFKDLVKMIESIRQGESPQTFNPHMNELLPPTTEKSGPGW